MDDSFWTGGADAYEAGLHQHYELVIRELRDRLIRCSDEGQRATLESDLKSVEIEYRQKISGIDRLLF
jgi:hypothetical protein